VNILKKIIKKENFEGNIYCIQSGERAGQFLLFLTFNEKKSMYSVLTIPECEPIFVSVNEIKKYLSENLVEFIEKTPKDVLEESILEFNLRNSLIKQ